MPPGGQERRNGVNEVSEVDLIEVGPTLRGANAEAQLQAVKTALREANNGTGVHDLDPDLDWEFRARKQRWDELWRKRDEEARRDRELAQTIAEVRAKKARTEKRNRPIQVKTFTFE